VVKGPPTFFKVSAPVGPRRVEFAFASDRDLETLRHWRTKKTLKTNAHLQDSIEYCRLASKRWRTYSKSKRTVTTFEELRETIVAKPEDEVVFIMVARAEWHRPSQILGFCFCRRSWCHHLILDFAAAHPNAILLGGGEIRGVGSSMLYSLVNLARQLGIDLVWGEATSNSAAFYRKVLRTPEIADHFFIKGETYHHCLRQFDAMDQT
jgi:hypothetical protein